LICAETTGSLQNQVLTEFAQAQVTDFAGHGLMADFSICNVDVVTQARSWVGTIPTETQGKCIAVLNMLETWTMNFTWLIADSETAYQPASDIFCRTVVWLYPFLIVLRASEDPELFANVEMLFKDWQSRKDSKALERQAEAAAQHLEEIREMIDRKPYPAAVGTEI
jgi:hypothetical protein